MKCLHKVRTKYGYVDCGQCMACRLNYARMWAIRIMCEAKMHTEMCFLTLTYDDAHLPRPPSVIKRDLQLFFKRLRKKAEIRYYAAGEYGDKYERPHYHVALFGVPIDSLLFLNRRYDPKKKVWFAYMKEWPFGHVAVGRLTEDSANYVARYITKKVKGKGSKSYYKEKGLEPEFCLMSRNPGIGLEFVQAYYNFLKNNKFLIFKGKKVALPRYFFEKVFTEEERKVLSAEVALQSQADVQKFWNDIACGRKKLHFVKCEDLVEKQEAEFKARKKRSEFHG